MNGPCMCGDSECSSCGSTQGTKAEHVDQLLSHAEHVVRRNAVVEFVDEMRGTANHLEFLALDPDGTPEDEALELELNVALGHLAQYQAKAQAVLPAARMQRLRRRLWRRIGRGALALLSILGWVSMLGLILAGLFRQHWAAVAWGVAGTAVFAWANRRLNMRWGEEASTLEMEREELRRLRAKRREWKLRQAATTRATEGD